MHATILAITNIQRAPTTDIDYNANKPAIP